MSAIGKPAPEFACFYVLFRTPTPRRPPQLSAKPRQLHLAFASVVTAGSRAALRGSSRMKRWLKKSIPSPKLHRAAHRQTTHCQTRRPARRLTRSGAKTVQLCSWDQSSVSRVEGAYGRKNSEHSHARQNPSHPTGTHMPAVKFLERSVKFNA